MTLIRTAWSFLHTRKRMVAIIIIFQLAQVLLSLWLPALNAAIIDRGILPGNSGIIWRYGLLMLGISLLQIACTIVAIYAGSRTSMEFGRELRARIFRKVQSFSPADQHRFGAPTLITRTTNDITQVQTVVMMTFTVMIMAPIMGVGGIIMALQQDTQLSLLLLIIVPVLGLIIAGVMAGLTSSYKIQQQRIDRINTLLREQLTGVRVIRAFVRQRDERKKFEAANADLRSIWLRIGLLWSLLMPATMIVIGLSSTAVVWFGGFRVDAGQMEVGSLTAYINYLMMILGAVMMSGMMAMMFPRGEVSANRLRDIEETVPSIQSPAQPVKLPATPLTFELRDVTLQYEGAEQPVLEHLDATISPGCLTGIIGSTGSGKSSLIRLFPRLIDATSGRVLAGGVDVRDVDVKTLRQRIAFVPQRAFLFSGTIASNIAGLPSDPAALAQDNAADNTAAHNDSAGNNAAHSARKKSARTHAASNINNNKATSTARIDEARIQQALEAAQAWEFVNELDKGIYTRVESGGKNFSGGQRQRLTIARAIYRCLPATEGYSNKSPQADLLIFDDSFSALDFATDAALRSNLRNYLPHVAILIVAQRISTIRSAHEIIVLADGHIEARGTHNDLMLSSSTYQEIVRSQLTEEEAR